MSLDAAVPLERAAAAEAAVAMVELREVSRRFEPRPTLGERIATAVTTALGAQAAQRTVHAVDRVSLSIMRGEVLGLVGESGCGKSTLGRMLAGIVPPSAGEVRIGGAPVMSAGPRPRKCTTRVQMVFQDPQASLDPRMRVGDAVAEGPLAHGLVSASEAPARVAAELARVGLDADAARRYPHQFSGGQRQRIAIARALAMQPEVLVCDEPVASLDVSIQAQVLNLLAELRRELGLTMLFISHHLGVVRHLSDRLAVMYLGRIVELGSVAQVTAAPQHPYTQALLTSVPRLTLDEGVITTFRPIAGELPSPVAPPAGCHFHPRCLRAVDRCRSEVPVLRDLGHTHRAACHLPGGAPGDVLAES
jgi:peptide/nickel transport system ATP-binding protein